MSRIKLIIISVLVVIAAVVTVQNTQQVDMHILFFAVSMPRAVLLLLMGLIGFAIGVFTVFHYIGKRKDTETKNDN